MKKKEIMEKIITTDMAFQANKALLKSKIFNEMKKS